MRRVLPPLIGLLALAGAVGHAQEAIPPNDGWVTDLADFLTPSQERSLEALMESYKVGSTHEIALLTVPDLKGRSLERFALEVARGWGLGTVERSNGALLLVSRGDRKIRIEVGRGLEGTITDSISGRIIRDVIAPEFKRGRFYEGLRGGIEAMHAAAGGEYGKIPRRRGKPSAGTELTALLPLIFFFLLFANLSRRSGRRGGCLGGILPWVLLGSVASRRGSRAGGFHGGFGGGGFGGFGGGGGFSGGGASGGW